MIAPNPSAPRISQTVSSMLLMPPPEKSVSIDSTPLVETIPGRHRRVDPFDEGERRAKARIVSKLDHEVMLGERGQDAGEERCEVISRGRPEI